MVHTHPFFEGENTTGSNVCGVDGSVNYTSGTNMDDIGFLVDMQTHLSNFLLKGYIIDGSNILTFGTLPNTLSEDERCGY